MGPTGSPARAEPLGATVDAVVVRWETAVGRPPRAGNAVAARVRHRLAALSELGIDLLLITSSPARRVEATLPPATGPGVRWLWPTRSGRPIASTPDGPEALPDHRPPAPARGPRAPRAVRAFLAHLEAQGIGPGLVLLVLGPDDADLLVAEAGRSPAVAVGDLAPAGPAVRHAGGGAATVLALLDEQRRRRRHRRVPTIDEDPGWVLRAPAGVPRRAVDTLFGLEGGGVGTRGSAEEDPGAAPTVLAQGVYRGDGAAQELRPLPSWTGLALGSAPHRDDRVLDLRTGVVLREETDGPDSSEGPDVRLRTVRFASATRPGVMALRAEAARGRLRPGPALRVPPGERAATGGHGASRYARVGAGDGRGGAVAAAVEHRGRQGPVGTVERLARYATGSPPPRVAPALAGLDEAGRDGFDRLLRDHRAAWARRWDDVDVRIPDDPELQRALRFCLFHLWGLASGAARGAGHRELAIGARGTSGRGYRGHVFWDADVFVVPALATLDPAASRAALCYRLARLPAARDHARRHGRPGARFPWESAAGGEDVTPTAGLLGARPVAIRTGAIEEHITADVAWAAVHHATWCREPQFLLGPARALLVETARYWAARCRVDDDGRAHVDGVIGPDEYHEDVDDDAYTNIMARWNLRAAADTAQRAGVVVAEAARWRDLADRIVDGLDPVTGAHEQFAGYDALRPLPLEGTLRAPVAADVVLGHDRVAGTQVIKQPDVLMAHHLVPGEAGPAALGADLDRYGPRTAHGSSLSPGITASLLARAGRTAEAVEMLRTAVSLDLQDLTGTTVSGLHVGAMGAAWQAVLTGFAGVRVEHGVLRVDPRPPASWSRFEVRFRALGRRLRVRTDGGTTTVTTDLPLAVGVHDAPPTRVVGSMAFPRTSHVAGRPA
ncbi:glycosyl hydrolase family 65 protein [Actinomycetospora sp. C-140]